MKGSESSDKDRCGEKDQMQWKGVYQTDKIIKKKERQGYLSDIRYYGISILPVDYNWKSI